MEITEILINWLKERNEADFEELYKYYKPFVYRYVYNLAPALEEFAVTDIVQDVFVEVYSKSQTLKEPAKFKAWLYSITKHRLARYFRKEKQQMRKVEKQKEEMAARFSLQSPVEQKSEQKYFQDIILKFQERLKPKQREIFTLRFFDGEKYDNIAAVCRCSVRKVKYDVEKIFFLFQQYLKEKGL